MARCKNTEVRNGKEKEVVYRTRCVQYKKAMGCAFYFEAFLISGAMLEDRLLSALYHAGMIKSPTECRTLYYKTRAYICACVEAYNRITEKSVNAKRVNTLANQTGVMAGLLAQGLHITIPEAQMTAPLAAYMAAMRSRLSAMDCAYYLEVLGALERWREKRNIVVHSLFHHRAECVEEMLPQLAEQGYHIARALDNLSEKFRSYTSIKKAISSAQR